MRNAYVYFTGLALSIAAAGCSSSSGGGFSGMMKGLSDPLRTALGANPKTAGLADTAATAANTAGAVSAATDGTATADAAAAPGGATAAIAAADPNDTSAATVASDQSPSSSATGTSTGTTAVKTKKAAGKTVTAAVVKSKTPVATAGK